VGLKYERTVVERLGVAASANKRISEIKQPKKKKSTKNDVWEQMRRKKVRQCQRRTEKVVLEKSMNWGRKRIHKPEVLSQQKKTKKMDDIYVEGGRNTKS